MLKAIDIARSHALRPPRLGHPAYSAPTHEASSCGVAPCTREERPRLTAPRGSPRVPRAPMLEVARLERPGSVARGARRVRHRRRERGGLLAAGGHGGGEGGCGPAARLPWAAAGAGPVRRAARGARPPGLRTLISCNVSSVFYPPSVYSKWTRRYTAGAPGRGATRHRS